MTNTEPQNNNDWSFVDPYLLFRSRIHERRLPLPRRIDDNRDLERVVDVLIGIAWQSSLIGRFGMNCAQLFAMGVESLRIC